jgi:hypothetical protein
MLQTFQAAQYPMPVQQVIRLTALSTIVLRDATGSFGSNVITASLFSGDGSGINAINASNISSGTVANARTTAASANGASTIVLRDSSGSFSAGDITANSISGNGVSLSAINASNITSGTIANARTTAASANGASTIVLRGLLVSLLLETL